MKEKGEIQFDEFYLSEVKTDNLADQLADKIMDKGYTASSQSEKNLAKIGVYDLTNNTTPLPHKTVARLAGWGWIGKHNLLVTHAHGSAISMCTVLTNAPLQGSKNKLVKPDCGRCNRCVEVCATAALSGTTWNMGIERNKMVNVKTCTTCLQCMMQCKFTQAYAAGTSEQSFSLE
jgi:epoxyqueuosine reductase QueG